MPDAAAIRARYAGSQAGMPGQLREWRTGTTQGKWYDYLAHRVKRLAPAGAQSIADVGAGALELAVSLAQRFPTARVTAMDLFLDDFNPRLPGEVRDRIGLTRIDLNEISVPPGQRFDLVTSVAVIEHVLDPIALLRLVRSITAPGGVAFIMGPEVTSFAHRILGRSWPYYCPEDHLTLPTLKAIEGAVRLAGGGEFHLRRAPVGYSLRYLLRFLRLPIPLPAAADVLLPLPTGAFELFWRPVQDQAPPP